MSAPQRFQSGSNAVIRIKEYVELRSEKRNKSVKNLAPLLGRMKYDTVMEELHLLHHQASVRHTDIPVVAIKLPNDYIVEDFFNPGSMNKETEFGMKVRLHLMEELRVLTDNGSRTCKLHHAFTLEPQSTFWYKSHGMKILVPCIAFKQCNLDVTAFPVQMDYKVLSELHEFHRTENVYEFTENEPNLAKATFDIDINLQAAMASYVDYLLGVANGAGWRLVRFHCLINPQLSDAFVATLVSSYLELCSIVSSNWYATLAVEEDHDPHPSVQGQNRYGRVLFSKKFVPTLDGVKVDPPDYRDHLIYFRNFNFATERFESCSQTVRMHVENVFVKQLWMGLWEYLREIDLGLIYAVFRFEKNEEIRSWQIPGLLESIAELYKYA